MNRNFWTRHAERLRFAITALPFVRKGATFDSRCITCARQVYVMPDPARKGAAIGGDANKCARGLHKLNHGRKVPELLPGSPE